MNEKHTMDILVDYEYLDAVIRYGRVVSKAFKRGDHEYVIRALAHETTHILTGEVKMTRRCFAPRLFDERATEHISRLLFRLFIKEFGI